jgi:hypothetical protein
MAEPLDITNPAQILTRARVVTDEVAALLTGVEMALGDLKGPESNALRSINLRVMEEVRFLRDLLQRLHLAFD